MIINTKNYPLIEIKNNTAETGIINKNFRFHKNFIVEGLENTLFTSDKKKLQSHFSSTYSKVKRNGFLLEILFHGLNYNAKRLKLQRQKYFIDVHKSELIIFEEPISIFFKSRIHKRRLIFFSYDRNLLKELEKSIKSFKLPNSYTGKGLFSRHDNYIVKEGKKRK